MGIGKVGRTQKITFPKSFPYPNVCPSEGFVSLVHGSALAYHGPVLAVGFVMVKHLGVPFGALSPVITIRPTNT